VAATAAATTALLSLLGAASLTGSPVLRGTADLAGAWVLLTYLRSPTRLAARAARTARTAREEVPAA
jgi:hypothetical protein